MRENRIKTKFDELKGSGKKTLIGFLTAGDPDLVSSERDIRCVLDEGLDILELGVPFSDPIADGPVIQAASQRALEAGTTPGMVLDLVERVRGNHENPIILFGYTNPFLAYGFEDFFRDAVEAGVDGILVVDLPFEEAQGIRETLRSYGLVLVPLIAPTTSRERTEAVLKEAEGFVYYIMVRGVTGARDRMAPDLEDHLSMIRKYTDLPVAAGFGISSGRQARTVSRWADGVVVGSALIQAARAGRLTPFVRELHEAVSKK